MIASRNATVKCVHLSAFTLVLVAGCAPSVEADANEREAASFPTVEFDPSNGVVPFPTNLLFDTSTGTLNLPEQCNESPAATFTRGLLNELDGYSTLEPAIRITFTEEVDPASLTDRAFLFQRTSGNSALDPSTAQAIPLVPIPSQTQRFSADCSTSSLVASVIFRPGTLDLACLAGLVATDNPEVCFDPQVLDPNSLYTLLLLDGVTTSAGDAFVGASTWGFIRGDDAPVTFDTDGTVTSNLTPLDPFVDEDLAQLQGLSALFGFASSPLAFADTALAEATGGAVSRDDILLATDFVTQSTTLALSAQVAGSAGASLAQAGTALTITNTTTDPGIIDATFQGALGDPGICGSLPCAAIGSIIDATISSPNFQVMAPATCSSTLCTEIPGGWDHPIRPNRQGDNVLATRIFVPAFPPAATGHPVVIFGHGFGRSQGDLFAIAAQLAGNGIASIAIDAVNSGSRAVRISDTGDCAGADPTMLGTECFASIFSTALNTTRDNFRQSYIDTMQLARVVEACGTSGCAGFPVDAARIGYLGQSLGGIMGVPISTMAPQIKTAVLNVAGNGWVDILTFTESLSVRCPLIDGLIASGLLTGTLAGPNPVDGGSALCNGTTWQTDPAFLQFSGSAKWVLDPSDGSNFVSLLSKPVLVQKVQNDSVIPNVTTDRLIEGLGLSETPAATAISATPSPTVAVISTSSVAVVYQELAADAGTMFPGNSYAHGSLLSPGESTATQLGLAQMQTDAITFFMMNL